MKKIKRNQIIITGLAILIATAGYINYSGEISDFISVKTSSSNVSSEGDEKEILSNDAEPDNPGSVVFTSGNSVNSSVISGAKLNREQIRAKNEELLLNIINDNTLGEEAKASAVSQLADITGAAEKELAAEILLEAKGFSDVVVSLLDNQVDVVIGENSINDVQKAQIEDIVKRKTGVSLDKITINVCNN